MPTRSLLLLAEAADDPATEFDQEAELSKFPPILLDDEDDEPDERETPQKDKPA
jgi:hypothetical protein